jgi:cell division protein FtsW
MAPRRSSQRKQRRSSSEAAAPARRPSDPDYLLAMAVAGLLSIGLLTVYSATFDRSYAAYGDSFRIASSQFLWTGIGIVLLVAVSYIPYDWWQQVAVPVMGGTLLLLFLVLIVGDDSFGARRSFRNGAIQPGELAKLASIVYIATWLASKGDQVRDLTYGLIPFSVLVGVVASLILMQPDISMAVLIALTAVSMFFFAGADIFHLAAGAGVAAVTSVLLVNRLPYASQRVEEYLKTWKDPTFLGHHVHQSLIAIGSGGLLGVGLGQGQQKLGGYLPVPHTDSVFAVIGEELGFVGCLLVIGLFALLAYRGFRIAQGASDAFGALLAFGITCWISYQALGNMSVMTGLVPFTGIALPFISSGGSMMLVSTMGVGLLLSVSRGKRIGKRGKRNDLWRADLGRRWRNWGTRVSRPGRRPSSRR